MGHQRSHKAGVGGGGQYAETAHTATEGGQGIDEREEREREGDLKRGRGGRERKGAGSHAEGWRMAWLCIDI